MNSNGLLFFKIVCLLFIFMVGSILVLNPVPTTDIYWHLQVGKDILVHKLWPSPDSYSYISNQEWTIHSWLFDIIIYSIYSNIDITIEQFSYFFRTIVISMTLIIFTLLMVRKKIFNNTSLVIIFLFLILIIDKSIRPHLLSTSLFVCALYYFHNTTPSIKSYLCLGFLNALWCNIHGYFILITASSFIILTYYIIKWLFINEFKKREILGNLFIIFCSFLNPHPINLFYRIISAPFFPSNDWKSVFWWMISYPLSTFPVIIIIMITIYYYIYWVKDNYHESYLNTIVFDTICMILSLLFIRSTWLIVAPLTTLLMYSKKIKEFTILETIVTIVILLFMYKPSTMLVYEKMPSTATNYMKLNNLNGNIYSPLTWSGYITWMTDKDLQVYVDTRFEPFTKEQILKSMHVADNPNAHIELLKNENTHYFMLPFFDKQEIDTAKYTLLYEDKNVFIGKIN